MVILTLINLILLLLLGFYLFKDKIKFNTSSGISNQNFLKFDDSFSEYEKKLLTKIHTKFYKYSDNYVPMDIFYAVLWQESGGEILNDKENKEIISDNGNSVGYMQINKQGALKEFNKRENTNYTFNDIKEKEELNIKIGRAYLFYAIQIAFYKSKDKPYQWLVFKIYNGGLDETEKSDNKLANSYANSCYAKFLKVNKFIRLNSI